MLVVKKEGKDLYSIPTIELRKDSIKAIGSELAQKILKLITKEPLYPADIAKKLKVHEQKVYYHTRNLEKEGIIKVVKKEEIHGAVANFYGITEPSLLFRFKDFEKTFNVSYLNKEENKSLEPFIINGKLNCIIIVGSPEPHGPQKAKARDSFYALDFTMFLGTFLNNVPTFNIRLDTEVRDNDLKNNLIIIGGPVVNRITETVNEALPIFFNKNKKWAITSRSTKKVYTQDECGIIVKTKNPFDKNKSILVIAGKRYMGTKAAIVAFLKNFDTLVKKGNNFARVVEGIDINADGQIDSIEFKE